MAAVLRPDSASRMPLISNLKSLLGKHTISDNTPSPASSPPSRKSKEMPRSHPEPSSHPAGPPASGSSAQPSAAVPVDRAPPAPAAPSAASGAATNSKEQAELLIRRENEAKARREAAAYEGLPPGITLGLKMGDGAFSNVYQATLRPTRDQLAMDPNIQTVTVAVKCVRKFELNHSQVSTLASGSLDRHFATSFSSFSFSVLAYRS